MLLCCDVCVVMLCVMVWLVVNVVVRWNEWFYAVWGFCWQTDRQMAKQTLNPQVSFLCCFIITIFTIYCFSFMNRLYMSLQMSSLCSLVFTMLTLIFNPFMCCSQSGTASAEHPPFLKKNLAECSGVEFSILYEPLCIFIHRKFFKKSIFIHFHLFSSSWDPITEQEDRCSLD